MPSSYRLFVAVYPPLEAVRALHEVLATHALSDHRRVPAGQVHLTLHFIGDVDRRNVDDVAESVERSAAGLPACTLTADRLITLPKRGDARLIAAATDSPATILEIHRRLVHRLARAPRRSPNDRYLPHLTLCRFRKPSHEGRLDATIEPIAFAVDHVALVRSTLHHDGARHVELERFALE